MIDSTQNSDTEKSSHNVFSAQGALAGARILLVEDSYTNRMIVRRMLEDMGCVVVDAENGQAGVERLKTDIFDLVLMDCEMPVMDGFEASKQIRHLEKSGQIIQRVVIIALTANAMEGDKNKCLSVGMDDHMPKSVRHQELYDMLSKYLFNGVAKKAMDEIKKQMRANVMRAPMIDKNIFEDAQSIMKNKFSDVIKFYIEDVKNYISEIHQAMNNGDKGGVVTPAHTIKSSSQQIGAMAVATLAMEIEADAREKECSIPNIELKLKDLEKSFIKTEIFLTEFLLEN